MPDGLPADLPRHALAATLKDPHLSRGQRAARLADLIVACEATVVHARRELTRLTDQAGSDAETLIYEARRRAFTS